MLAVTPYANLTLEAFAQGDTQSDFKLSKLPHVTGMLHKYNCWSCQYEW
jgi:hypothetical protein